MKVCIIGMGLIGGSLGISLKKSDPTSKIVAVVRKKKYVQKILSKGAADEVCLDPAEGVKGADWIILATPPLSFGTILRKIKPVLKRQQIITDVGSIKEFAMKTYRKILKKDFSYIGSHPIAGSEKAGIEASQDGLFKNAICIVTPDQNTKKETLEKTLKFWKKVGSKPMVKTEQEHDQIFAYVSHLPHILSFCLAKSTEKKKNFIPLSGEAWRDMTRVAHSSPELWTEIIGLNRQNVSNLLRKYRKELNFIEKKIKENRLSEIKSYFEKAKKVLENGG